MDMGHARRRWSGSPDGQPKLHRFPHLTMVRRTLMTEALSGAKTRDTTSMLSGMRKASNNIVGRVIMTVVMSLLIVSFGIFGIGSWLAGGGVGSLAKVGSTPISVETFRATFASNLQRLSQQARRNITTEEARSRGFDRQVLGQLLNEAALEEEARRLGLIVTDEIVVKTISDNPAFKGQNGQFDRTLFQRFAQNSQLSEAGLLQQQKLVMQQQQVIEGLTGALQTPRIMVDAVNRQLTEERTIAYVVVPTTSVERFAPPDDRTLESFYAGRKADFAAPEYRKVTLLSVNPEDFTSGAPLTDDDLRLAYDDAVAAGQLGRPEKRSYQQIVYNTAAEANAAEQKLQAGSSFADLLAEKNLKAEDVTFTEKAKSELADPIVADAAFTLRKGETSQPVAGNFGFTIVHINDIVSGTVVPFEAAKDGLGAAARQRKVKGDSSVQGKVDALHDQIEDQRSSGKALAEIAADLKLKPVGIDAVDPSGLDKAGKPATVPDGASTLAAIFSTTIGADNEALRSRAGGYIWYEVSAIEPPHDRSLEEIRPRLITAWIANETAAKLADITADNLKKLKDGASLEQIAEALKGRVDTASGLTRTGGSPQAIGLGNSLITQTFAVPVEGYGEARAAAGSDRVLFKVTDARVPPADPKSPAITSLKAKLDAALADDLGAEYVRKLQADLGTSIDERLFLLALGNN